MHPKSFHCTGRKQLQQVNLQSSRLQTSNIAQNLTDAQAMSLLWSHLRFCPALQVKTVRSLVNLNGRNRFKKGSGAWNARRISRNSLHIERGEVLRGGEKRGGVRGGSVCVCVCVCVCVRERERERERENHNLLNFFYTLLGIQAGHRRPGHAQSLQLL